MSGSGAETVYRFGGDAGGLLGELVRIRSGLGTTNSAARETSRTIADAADKARSSMARAADAARNWSTSLGAATGPRVIDVPNWDTILGASNFKRAADATQSLGNAHVQTAGKVKLDAMQMQQMSYQLNDFFVQVAGGQGILMPLIQQGSQLSGTFGGIGNAIKAVGSLLTPMVLGVGGVSAAVAAFGYAAYKAHEQDMQLVRTLGLTANAAGQTKGSIEALTRSAAASSGGTVGGVREIADQLLSLGTLGPQAYSSVTAAAATYQRATASTAADSVAAFSKIADGATKWALETNRQYHFLTLATYEQIKALENQGRSQEAVAVAADAFNAGMHSRIGNLDLWQRAWQGVRGAIDSVQQRLLGLFSDETAERAITRIQGQLRALDERKSTNPAATEARRAALTDELENANIRRREEQRLATMDAERVAGREAAIQGQQRIDRLSLELDKRAQLTKELGANARAFADVNTQRAKEGMAPLPQGQLDRLQELTREKYKEPAKPKPAEDGLLQSIRERRAAMLAEADSETKLTEQQRFAIDVRTKLADATRKITGAARERVQAELAGYEKDAQALRRRQLFNLGEEESNRLAAERARLVQSAEDALAGFTRAQERGIDDLRVETSMLGATAEEQAKVTAARRLDAAVLAEHQRITGLQREAVRSGNIGALNDLDDQRRELEAQAATIRGELMPAIEERYRRERSWQQGVEAAQKGYRQLVIGDAALVQSALTRAYSAAEDAFVHMGTTGRLSVDNLLKGIAEDTLRLTYRKTIAPQASQGIADAVQSAVRFLIPGATARTATESPQTNFRLAELQAQKAAEGLGDAAADASSNLGRFGFGLDRVAGLFGPFGSSVMDAVRALSAVGGGQGGGIWGQLAGAVGSYFGRGTSYGGSVSGGTGVAGAVGNNPSAYVAPTSLAVGTNYVPYDGFLARLHKGEAVVPASYNPAAGGRPARLLQAQEEAAKSERARGGSSSAKPVRVQLVNNSGQQMQATANTRETDMEQLVEIVLDRVANSFGTGGRVDEGFRSVYPANRAAGLLRRA